VAGPKCLAQRESATIERVRKNNAYSLFADSRPGGRRSGAHRSIRSGGLADPRGLSSAREKKPWEPSAPRVRADGQDDDSPARSERGALESGDPRDDPGQCERRGQRCGNEKGEMRAVLRPEPGRRYRVRFTGVHEPNMPAGITAEGANKQGYEAFPTQSAPVELKGGTTIRLRFILHNTE
jgi:hypothetical protein